MQPIGVNENPLFRPGASKEEKKFSDHYQEFATEFEIYCGLIPTRIIKIFKILSENQESELAKGLYDFLANRKEKNVPYKEVFMGHSEEDALISASFRQFCRENDKKIGIVNSFLDLQQKLSTVGELREDRFPKKMLDLLEYHHSNILWSSTREPLYLKVLRDLKEDPSLQS